MSTPTLTLYHCRDSRSLRPLWALEALKIEGKQSGLDIDYQLINMEFPPRYKYPNYLEINPLGTVPTFIDNNNAQPITLTESAAICQYLVDKHPQSSLGLSVDHPEYGEYLNWLHRSDATFTFPQALVLRYQRYEPEERLQPQVVEDYRKWFCARIRSIESALENKTYLCANRLTIADICVGYALFLADSIGISDCFGELTKAYFTRLTNKPSFKNTLAQQANLEKIF